MNTVQNIRWSQIRCIFCRPDLQYKGQGNAKNVHNS